MAIEESKLFVGDLEAISAPGEFVANAYEPRPVKSLFWACINFKEGCF
jgi:hypothetical protein